jgi:hypothetical protein
LGFGRKEVIEMPIKYNDGGRQEAGWKGTAGDCAVRSLAIATGKPYQEVYDLVNSLAKSERTGKRKKGKSSARNGVYKQTFRKAAEKLGGVWTATMQIGSGCKVHLAGGELPNGNLVAVVSRHFVAVIDGVINDTHDCSRGGPRCVYGYYTF